jgi:hypothetical protein
MPSINTVVSYPEPTTSGESGKSVISPNSLPLPEKQEESGNIMKSASRIEVKRKYLFIVSSPFVYSDISPILVYHIFTDLSIFLRF